MWFPPSPYDKNKIQVKINLENYATKADLKAATGIDTSGFTKKTDFDDLKKDVKKLQDTPHTTSDDTKKEL